MAALETCMFACEESVCLVSVTGARCTSFTLSCKYHSFLLLTVKKQQLLYKDSFHKYDITNLFYANQFNKCNF